VTKVAYAFSNYAKLAASSATNATKPSDNLDYKEAIKSMTFYN